MADQLRYATAAVDNSPELLAIADALTARTGRPRNIPFRALLIVCCLHARVEPTNMYRTRIADLLVSLTATQRRDLGITSPISYSQVERAALKLDRAARDGITLPHLADDQTAQTLHLDTTTSTLRRRRGLTEEAASAAVDTACRAGQASTWGSPKGR